eukprot:765521-Hanusia_phi.AAC.18
MFPAFSLSVPVAGSTSRAASCEISLYSTTLAPPPSACPVRLVGDVISSRNQQRTRRRRPHQDQPWRPPARSLTIFTLRSSPLPSHRNRHSSLRSILQDSLQRCPSRWLKPRPDRYEGGRPWDSRKGDNQGKGGRRGREGGKGAC